MIVPGFENCYNSASYYVNHDEKNIFRDRIDHISDLSVDLLAFLLDDSFACFPSLWSDI